MKVLITIPHYYNADNQSIHGSGKKDPRPRLQALAMCILNLHALLGNSQYIIDIFNKKATDVNKAFTNDIDIVICTANNKHLLEHLKMPINFYKHHSTALENPKFLGFECQKILKENLGKYDYYCFMEDDLIISDPLFFEKIKWFSDDYINLLQPNRYEVSTRGRVLKSYVDGDIRPAVTENYQNVDEINELSKEFLNQNILFQRPYNPHSGCYFLAKNKWNTG